jgi:SacI restriction endonuclease
VPHRIKPTDALALMSELFPLAEDDFREQAAIDIPAHIASSTGRLFSSDTQAYREALVGCAIARILNAEIDIRLPSTESGKNAFSGRSLADNAVTPFLRERAIPVSVSPYLSSLRGGAKFIKGGAPRIQRDPLGFEALVDIVDYLREINSDEARSYLRYLLRCFIQLREAGNIVLKRISAPSLEQLRKLITAMLRVKSGGRISSMFAVAMFQTISECHALGWTVEFQGINVADVASGAVGDITISKDGELLLGVEVTERIIDQSRITLTFDRKMSPSGLLDYLFITTTRPEEEALAAARSYTAVGHEMNFVPLIDWLIYNLATIGRKCRALFQTKMIDLLSGEGIPAEIRVAWNDKLDEAIGVKTP